MDTTLENIEYIELEEGIPEESQQFNRELDKTLLAYTKYEMSYE